MTLAREQETDNIREERDMIDKYSMLAWPGTAVVSQPGEIKL